MSPVGRPQKPVNRQEMIDVAKLYYGRRKLKVSAIAKELGIDPRKVSMLLEQALESNVVTITINSGSSSKLQNQIKDRYPHLKEIKIVPGSPVADLADYSNTIARLATEGTSYFESQVEQHVRLGKAGKPFRVGISGGETLLAFVNRVPERQRPDLHVHVTALVGLGKLDMSVAHVDPATNAMILWAKSGHILGQCHLATVTPYGTPENSANPRQFIAKELEKLANNKAIAPVLKEMDLIDIVFTSIGTLLSPVQQFRSDLRGLGAKEFRQRVTALGVLEPLVALDDLESEGAVANLSYCLIDKNGESRPSWEFFLTAGYNTNKKGIAFYQDMVKRGKTVVCIAGPYKVKAIRAALRAKAFNVWITDEASAEEMANGD